MSGFVFPPLRIALLASLGLLAVSAADAADPAPQADDVAAIRAAARAYLDALERGDGKACAALWTPDGDIVDDLGTVLPGRDTVATSAPAPAAAAKPEVRMNDTRIRFLTPDVAIEDGTIEIGAAGGTASLTGRFSATWMRHDGSWKLAALREARAADPSGPAALKQLDWMVGEWEIEHPPAAAPLASNASAHPAVGLAVTWNDTKTFLVRELTLGPAGRGGTPMSISQRIGWDPLTRSIRSWAFGSDGSHAEGTWHRDGGAWIARVTTVRPDGSQIATINIYTYDGKNRCVWRSIPTHIGTEHAQPMSVTLVRKPGSGPH